MFIKQGKQRIPLIILVVLVYKQEGVESVNFEHSNSIFTNILQNANASTSGRLEPGMGCSPVQGETCACQMTDGSGKVDISSLTGSGGSPKFKDTQGPDGSGSFSFTPCGTFTEGACQQAAMCMTSGEIQEQIGDGERIIFIYDQSSKSPIAAYTHRTPEFMFVSEVILKCDPHACDPEFEPQGQKEAHYFRFQLTSVCACPGLCTASGPTNCKSKHSGSGGVSGGTILIIGISASALLYLVVGIVYGMVIRKATGTEVIPNKSFWVSLPGLVKTGVLFTIGKCMRKTPTYNSI